MTPAEAAPIPPDRRKAMWSKWLGRTEAPGTRFRIGRSWRISPRLRVDYREIHTDASTQWTYTPAFRLEYRHGKKVRVELMAGQQFSTRESTAVDQDRESYYVSLGYQLFF